MTSAVLHSARSPEGAFNYLQAWEGGMGRLKRVASANSGDWLDGSATVGSPARLL